MFVRVKNKPLNSFLDLFRFQMYSPRGKQNFRNFEQKNQMTNLEFL